MSTAKSVTFGPGSLEDIRLEHRVSGARRDPPNRHVDARVRGTYRIYCGNGGEHTVTIKGPWLIVEYPELPHARVDTGAKFTDADALAAELIEWELESSGWSDPCEVDQCGSCGAVTNSELRVDGEPFHEPDADCRSVVSS